MTYDFHSTWNDKVGINSPLFDQPKDKLDSPEHSVNGCVERWVRDGADKSKINIGLPFYGRSYSGTTELYSTFDGADALNWWADEGQPQYYNILDKLTNMTSLRDDVTKTQFAYFEDGSGVVSFDDSQSICDKVEYALGEELHGYIIWELSGDLTEDFRTPLLDAVNFKLEQGDTFECESFRLETRDENGEVVKQEIGKPDPWYGEFYLQGIYSLSRPPLLGADTIRCKLLLPTYLVSVLGNRHVCERRQTTQMGEGRESVPVQGRML